MNMTDQEYMRRAIELAKKGTGWTNPNPLVGAVIVKNGKIIGEGYHTCYGKMHAEREAFASLKESAQGADLYVTLEPCCHYGKQPPCTDAILAHKVRRVVIGSRDPNPQVAGKGAAILRKAGILVEEDFLREECDALNPVFFHFITKGTPYVVMKYAMTCDGKIATRTGASKWITGEDARNLVQEFRYTYSGIMAGIGTVLADDPMLNVRIPGKRSPVRIICDDHLRIPLDSNIVKTAREYRTILATLLDTVAAGPLQASVSACIEETSPGLSGEETKDKIEKLKEAGVEILAVPGLDGRIDLQKLMLLLGEKKIDSILLEGGGILNDSALRAGVVHEVKAFIAPKLFGGGDAKSPVEGRGVELPAEAVALDLISTRQIGADLLLEYRVRR